MKTCFLFAGQLEDTTVFSACFSHEGRMIAPWAFRPFEAVNAHSKHTELNATDSVKASTQSIQALQQDARTIVVIPAKQCTFHYVSLPKLSDRKLRAAIPYALEEDLAQEVSMLHFAFDQSHREDNQFLVVVIDKAYLKHLLQQFDNQGVRIDQVTTDWFALERNQICIKAPDALVRSLTFNGALSFEQVQASILNESFDGELFDFDNAVQNGPEMSQIPMEESYEDWVARRLLSHTFINLCQGAFDRGKQSQSLKFWYGLSAGFAGVWLLAFIVVHAIQISMLNHKIGEVDQEIATIYRKFFPNAKQVISPEFRIRRMLQDQTTASQDGMWLLIATLAKHLSAGQCEIEKIAYQKALLRVTLRCARFSVLEQLEQRLKQDGVNVKQLSASSEQSQVLATLELRL